MLKAAHLKHCSHIHMLKDGILLLTADIHMQKDIAHLPADLDHMLKAFRHQH